MWEDVESHSSMCGEAGHGEQCQSDGGALHLELSILSMVHVTLDLHQFRLLYG